MSNKNTENKGGFKGLMTAKSGGGLFLRILILVVIPEAYVMLCGLIVDSWLHKYEWTNFVFYSWAAIAIIAAVLIICTIVWFVQSRKGRK